MESMDGWIMTSLLPKNIFLSFHARSRRGDEKERLERKTQCGATGEYVQNCIE